MSRVMTLSCKKLKNVNCWFDLSCTSGPRFQAPYHSRIITYFQGHVTKLITSIFFREFHFFSVYKSSILEFWQIKIWKAFIKAVRSPNSLWSQLGTLAGNGLSQVMILFKSKWQNPHFWQFLLIEIFNRLKLQLTLKEILVGSFWLKIKIKKEWTFYVNPVVLGSSSNCVKKCS